MLFGSRHKGGQGVYFGRLDKARESEQGRNATITFTLGSCLTLYFHVPIANETPKTKHFNFILPPPGVSVAGRGPEDSTRSVECSSDGWSGCAGSAAATEPQ